MKDRWEALRNSRKHEESNVITEINAIDPDTDVKKIPVMKFMIVVQKF